MPVLDQRWVGEVCRACDPVLAAADVGFVRQVMWHPDGGGVQALLWEADPARFAARYPESGIVESYGEEQWPGVGCVDFWVYLDRRPGFALVSVEGWQLPELWVALDGHDGFALSAVFARVLGLPTPE